MYTIKGSLSPGNILFLAAVILFCLFQDIQASEPLSNKGIIDLRNWNFSKEGVVELNGEWEFYPDKYFTPVQLSSGKIFNPVYVTVPGNWTEYSTGKNKMPSFGYATYRLKLVFNNSFTSSKQTLAVKIPEVFSAYKLWIDTTLVFQQGIPGKNFAEHQPVISPAIINFLLLSDTTSLTFQVANYFTSQNSGIQSSIQLGLSGQVNAQSLIKEYWYFGGTIFSFTLGIYFFFLFLMKQERKLNILFTLVCLLIGIRYLFDIEGIILLFFPNISAAFKFKVLLLCINFFPLTLWIIFIFFPREINKKVVQFVGILFILYSVFVIFVPIPSYGKLIKIIMALSGIVMLYIIIMSGLAYRRKRESSGIMFWGMLFAAIAFLNNMFGGKYYLPVGAILYLSLQAFAITSKHARSHNRVVQLSEDLQLMNKNLEVLVNERTKELNIANKTLEKLNFAKDKFISILSHDLRNPLSSLIGLSRRLTMNAEKNNTEKVIDYSKMINESASACHTLAENLLDWSLLQSGVEGVSPKKIYLKGVVDDVFDLLRNESVIKNIELINRISSGCEVYSDMRMTGSIIRNLLTNAIKFTPHYGKVEVSASNCNSYCQVSISDTGIGMEKDEVINLFRIDKKVYNLGTDDEPGSGYGLVLTKEFVKSNGGAISVKSEKGIGTTFTFSLPVDGHVPPLV